MKKKKIKNWFWNVIALITVCSISSAVLVNQVQPLNLSKPTLKRVPKHGSIDLISTRLFEDLNLIALPVPKAKIDAGDLSLQEWYEQENAKSIWQTILDCFDLKGEHPLEAQMVETFKFVLEDSNSVRISFTILAPYHFPDGGQYYSTVITPVTKKVPDVKKPTLFASIDLQGNYTIDQWIVHEQGDKPTENVDNKFNDLFDDKTSLSTKQIAAISIVKNITQELSISVQLDLKFGKFTDQSKTLLATTKLENVLVDKVVLKQSIDAEKQTLASWITSVNKDISAAIIALIGDPASLPVQDVEKISVSPKTDQSVLVSIQLKTGFVFKNKQNVLSGEIKLTDLGKKIKNLVFKDHIDLQREQTIDEWIASENSKDLSEKFNDLFVVQETALSPTEISEIKLNKASKDQVEVMIILQSGYTFDDDREQMSAKVKLTNWKTTAISSSAVVLIILGVALLLLLAIIAFSVSFPARRQRKINLLNANLEEQRLARLSAESTLASQTMIRSTKMINQRMSAVSGQINVLKNNPVVTKAMKDQTFNAANQPTQFVNWKRPPQKIQQNPSRSKQ